MIHIIIQHLLLFKNVWKSQLNINFNLKTAPVIVQDHLRIHSKLLVKNLNTAPVIVQVSVPSDLASLTTYLNTAPVIVQVLGGWDLALQTLNINTAPVIVQVVFDPPHLLHAGFKYSTCYCSRVYA